MSLDTVLCLTLAFVLILMLRTRIKALERDSHPPVDPLILWAKTLLKDIL